MPEPANQAPRQKSWATDTSYAEVRRVRITTAPHAQGAINRIADHCYHIAPTAINPVTTPA